MIPQLSGFDGIVSQKDKKYIRPHVRVGLTFYTHDFVPPIGSRIQRPRYINWDKQQTEATLISFAWDKQIGEASGKWSAVIKTLGKGRGLNFEDGDIIDGDWAKVTVMRNGVKFPLCIGTIDQVRRVKANLDGTTIEAWHISGRDHGAPFEAPIMWSSLYAQTLGDLVGGIFTAAVQLEVGGSPGKMFELLINATFKPNSESQKRGRSFWTFPSSLRAELGFDSFADALKIEKETTRGAYYDQLQLWTQVGQNLHATLEQWCNPLLNEYFYDLIDGRMVAQIHERPFVSTILGENSPWFKLPKHKIPNWLIGTDDVGRGGQERINLIEIIAIYATSNPQDQSAYVSPLIDDLSIAQHGLKTLSQKTKYIGPIGVMEKVWTQEADEWIRLLADWHGPNPFCFSGNVNVKTALPEIKVGSRLVVDSGTPKTSYEYFVEGVGLRYDYSKTGASASSNFTVTRGYPGTDSDRIQLVKDVSNRFEKLF